MSASRGEKKNVQNDLIFYGLSLGLFINDHAVCFLISLFGVFDK